MRDSVENLVTLFEHGTLNRQQLIQGLLAALAPISAVANAHADTSTTATFRGRSLNHVTLSVSDVERSKEFYSRLLGGTISFETEKGEKVEGANLALPDCIMGFYKLGEPRVHHFCVGVEDFSIDAALEKLKSDFPESKPTIYRGEELYFRDPDGILGQCPGWIIAGSAKYHEYRLTPRLSCCRKRERSGRWRQSAAGAALGGNPTLSFLETMTQNWLDARAKVKDAADGLGRRSRRPLVGQRRWQDSGQGRSLLRGGVVIGPALSHVCAIRRSRVVRRKVGWRTVIGGEPQAASNMAFKRDLPNRCESKMVVASEPWRDLSTVFGRHLNAGVRRMGTTL